MKPSIEDRKKFDLDLEYGEVKEDMVAEMLQDKKVEVKSERGMWTSTGNIAIEYMSYGKPSGLAATEADYWFHNLCIDDDVYATLVFKTDNLKKIIKLMDNPRQIAGGDHNASKMFLLNIQSLFDKQLINKFKESIKI